MQVSMLTADEARSGAAAAGFDSLESAFVEFINQPQARSLWQSFLSSRRASQLRSNASRCFEALRKRKKIDDAEARQIKCDKTAMLAHTWWDGPMVRVVALFLRSFRATQNPTCAKLVVWTPTQGSERATDKGKELVEAVEAMDGAPVVFQVLQTKELAHGTPFEDYVNRAILPHDWSTDKPGDKKEGTRHFSDFFQLFI